MAKESYSKKYLAYKFNKISSFADHGNTEELKDELADLIGFFAYSMARDSAFRCYVEKYSPSLFRKASDFEDFACEDLFEHICPDGIAENPDDGESVDNFFDYLRSEEEPAEVEEDPDENNVVDMLKRVFGKRS